MTEIHKPAKLARRGGQWLRTGNLEIHLGVEIDFRPALKAHPAIVATDVMAVANRLAAYGTEIAWDDNLPDRSVSIFTTMLAIG